MRRAMLVTTGPPPNFLGVTYVNNGGKSSSSTGTLDLTPPASTTIGDGLLMIRCMWNSNMTANDVSGWTNLADGTSGTGTANGNHTSRIRMDFRVADGTESPFGITTTGGGTVSGQCGMILRYANGTGHWEAVGCGSTVAGDTSHNGNRATSDSGTFSVAPGDVLVAGIAIDVATGLAASAPNITVGGTGTGVGTVSWRENGVGFTDGNDGNIYVAEAPYSGTSKTGAGAFSMSSGIAQCGPVGFVRIREVA
jgi:hypothetical protein